MTMIRDEQGKVSSGRILLWLWSALCAYAVLRNPDASNVLFAFLQGIELPLIAWVAGPRIARYLLPQLGAAVAAVGQAKRAARDAENGWQSAP